MNTTPTHGQIEYALKLRSRAESLALPTDVQTALFMHSRTGGAELAPEAAAALQAVRKSGDDDAIKAAKAELKAHRQAAVMAIVEDRRAKAAILAVADVEAMDKDQISAYIDAVKAVEL